jgi:signal transduction histidine kinase
MQIVVRNTGAPFVERAGPTTGIGLENVRRRLHHYYGSNAGLTLARDPHGATVATLRLPAADVEDSQSDVTTSEAPTLTDEHSVDAFSDFKTSRSVPS